MVPGNYSSCLGGCFSPSVAIVRTRSSLEEEGVILAHSFKVYSPAQQGRCDGRRVVSMGLEAESKEEVQLCL